MNPGSSTNPPYFPTNTTSMPTNLSNSPFLALRHDDSCGRHKTESITSSSSNGKTPFSSLGGSSSTSYANTNGHSNGITSNGQTGNTPYTNGYPQPTHGGDDFIKLDAPQQDVLLLHGPRQKYSLEKAQQIPELRADREILIQVLAVGLNPVDWKGADYGKSPCWKRQGPIASGIPPVYATLD